MAEAVRVGMEGMRNNVGGPFGCIIVQDDIIIGRGCNSVTSKNDPTAHAEIMAIRDACTNLERGNLAGCELYTTCEPCPMCLGAIYWSKPDKVYYSNTRFDARDAGFADEFIYNEMELAIEKRSISMQCIKVDEAKKMFEEWLTLNKIRY